MFDFQEEGADPAVMDRGPEPGQIHVNLRPSRTVFPAGDYLLGKSFSDDCRLIELDAKSQMDDGM